MNYSELRKSARKSLKGRWWLAAGAFFLFSLLNSPFESLLSPFTFFYQIMNIEVYDNSEIFTILVSHLHLLTNAKLVGEQIDNLDIIWSFITYGGLYLGSIYILFAISRYKEASIRDLFTYFRSIKLYWRGFWSVLLQMIYLVLWSLLLIVPGIVKSFSYAMTNYILIDHPELSANEAITKSRKMMNGHKGQLFVLYLTFIGWGILCVLSCGIGFIWLMPYIEAASIQFYFKLSGETAVPISD